MSLKFQLRQALDIQDEHNTKLTEAPPIHKKEKGKFAVLTPFAIIQADLIYMKPDGDYKYILSVVDVATRAYDAVALKSRTSQAIIEGFEQIFKRKGTKKHFDYINIKILYTDQGSEFNNNDFRDYMDDLGIQVKHTMTNRHSQMGIVEYFNHIITKNLYTKITTEELKTRENYDKWVHLLPKLVAVLNKKEHLKVPQLADFFKPPRTTATEIENRLQVGEMVHVRLQQPKDHLLEKNNKLHGNFRNGDVRFELKAVPITKVIILPNQPIRYMVEKYPNTSFMRKELLTVTEEPKAEEPKSKTKSKLKFQKK
jgi:transposase InsO family protein